MTLPRLLLALVAAGATAAAAPAQTMPGQPGPALAQPSAPAAAQPGARDLTEGYVLGPDDVVEVSVLGQPEFTTRARVRADGTIQLPFIGETPVAGQTALSLSDLVANKLRSGGYYAKPVVTAEIVSFASRYVVILGEIATPGLQPVDREYRVSEVIARAGGLRESGADFVILRREDGQEMKLPFEKLARGSDEDDPMVRAGDKLYVPPAERFYIYGQVNAPGVYPIKGVETFTVRKALARGGGLGPSGSAKRIKIFRNGEELKKVELDAEIQPGDVVVVGERIF
jgi:polysaccharide export outer membrane protein